MPSDTPRVVHVLAPGLTGGLERVVQMLAAAQGDRATVTVVLTPETAPGHPYVAELRASGIAVSEIVVGGRAYLQEHRALTRLIASAAPDAVHAHGYRPDIIAAHAARRARVATVSTVHGFTGGGLRNRVNEFLQGQALRRMDAVVAVSRPLVDRLTATGVAQQRIHLVPNAYAPVVPLRERFDARRMLGLPSESRIAGWVGRLSHEKGADVMLRALAAAPPEWRLAVIGDGAERPALLALADSLGISDRVTWLGARDNAGALLTAFDAFVLSSRTEGTPIVLFEAMAAETPIVATSVGGVPDVVTRSEALLVDPDNPRAIADALASLAGDPAAAAHRTARAAARLRDAYTPGGWVRTIDAVYRAAMANRLR